jgi:hypothetical protein
MFVGPNDLWGNAESRASDTSLKALHCALEMRVIIVNDFSKAFSLALENEPPKKLQG